MIPSNACVVGIEFSENDWYARRNTSEKGNRQSLSSVYCVAMELLKGLTLRSCLLPFTFLW